MNPISNPGAYNTVRLGGRLWIGKADVTGAADTFKWEKVAGQGMDGATSKFAGTELCDLVIKFFCWEQKHFDQFEAEFRPMFAPPVKGKKPQALVIEHPECGKLKITKVVVTKVGMLEQDGDTGLYFYAVAFSEFSPPKPVQVQKAKGAEGGPDDESKGLTPNQAKIEMLAKLRDQAKQSAGF